MAEKVDQMDPDEKIVEIAIERLRVFENHPFRVEMDSQMKDLQDSIKQYGLITPVNHINNTTRPKLHGSTPMKKALKSFDKNAMEKLGLEIIPPDEICLKPELLK